MKATSFAVLALLALAASANAKTWLANLNPNNEVPPVKSAGGQTARLFLSLGENDTYSGTIYIKKVEGLTMGHIHLGAKGSNGPPVLWFFPLDTKKPTSQPISGKDVEFSFKGSLATDLVGPLAGNITEFTRLLDVYGLYANIHTTKFGAGVARGQLQAK